MESKIRKETILKGGSQSEARGLVEDLRVPVGLFLWPRTHTHIIGKAAFCCLSRLLIFHMYV